MKLNTLLCLDSENIEKIRDLLLEEELEICSINEKGTFLEEISMGHLDIIFLDCSGKFLNVDIISTINNIKKLDPRLEIICCGLAKDTAVSIEAIKYGATHEKYIFAEMVSKNPVMLDIFNLAKRVSTAEYPQSRMYPQESIMIHLL
jgi:DNA-binding NtrC family response regulator